MSELVVTVRVVKDDRTGERAFMATTRLEDGRPVSAFAETEREAVESLVERATGPEPGWWTAMKERGDV